MTHRVLLVEDSAGDVRLVREALRIGGIEVDLEVVRHGEEAVARFARADLAAPDLVILDLNMPRMGGHAVLEARSRFPALSGAPFVVLSTSAAERDVARAYELGAAAVLTKPADLDAFVEMIGSIHALWLSSPSSGHGADAGA